MIKLIMINVIIYLIQAYNIAIIGCGAGGAATAHFLQDHNVTVFEASSQCGGRSDFINIEGYG